MSEGMPACAMPKMSDEEMEREEIEKERQRRDEAPALGRNDLLSLEDSEVIKVYIDDWDRNVYIRTVSGEERDRFTQETQNRQRTSTDLLNFRARFAVMVLCDADGKRLFTDQDVQLLGEKSAAALEQIFDAGLTLNKMGNTAVEEMAGNSDSGRNGDSGSD